MFDLFAQQADLEVLHVANYRDLNDDTVAKLTGLKKLKTLNLINGGISDAAVKTIAEAFPNLIALDVSSSSRLTDAATREIAKLAQLERLNLIFCDFSEFGLLNLAALPKLRAVDIRGNMKIGDGGMSALAMLPALRSLQHRSPSISDEGIRALTEAKSLDNLFIQDFSITGRSGEYIRQMEKLTSLTIFRCENFDSDGIRALKGLKLNRLTLRGLPIDDTAMEVFRDLPTVTRLYLQELSSITDLGMANIAFLKDLEILDIWEVPITDESMNTIAKFASLKTLMVRGTKVTDVGVEVLLTMPKLESVTLTDNADVTPAMIQKLRDAKKFTVLPSAR
jgi:Leucine-rich repeat (LRR) protein